ncbi:two-component system sensor histidine kinase NtrB [Paradesulfitobacterium ferrireducens]|uniref:two-component system sensor histidine kinase NtrB n=1 Tax=Paradesulfitobacterium ferrireducens TaxID=2816476 RepID=UPI001A8C3114|nr:ATP-binding protein [Paradesulfitobacterium ferrireducens]
MFSVWHKQSRFQKLLAGLFFLSLVLTLFCSFIYPSIILIRILTTFNIALAITGIFMFLRLVSDERIVHQKHIRTLRILLQQNLHQTVDYSREAIIIVNRNGNIIEASPKATELLASSHLALSGVPIQYIIKDYPSDLESANGEFVLKLSQGGERFIQYVKHPLLDHDVPSGTLLVLCDVSEEKKQFESYLQAAKFSVIAQLAGGLAHELRNPLTTIKGFVQLAGPDQWPVSLRSYHQLILDEIETTDRLLTQFVLLTNPSAPQLKPLNPDDLVYSAVQILKPTCLMQEVSLILDLPSHTPEVMGDEKQLTHTILSIIQNAIESSQPGQSIKISLTSNMDKIKLGVEDSGSGIAEDILKRVFDPFFTTRKGKTGLGLTIAQQIVLAHHGELTLSRPPSGQGTLVTLTLPIL